MTILKFNTDYANYSGLCQVNGKLLSAMQPNADQTAHLGTVFVGEIKFQLVDLMGAVVSNGTMLAGNHTVSARGGQYNPANHILGAEVSFNITVTPGNPNPLLSLAPFVGVRGAKPTMILVAVEAVEAATSDRFAVSAEQV